MLASPLKSLFISLFNMKETVRHHLSESEIQLIKNTNLFNTLDSEDFNEMLKSIKLVKYPAGKLILREGESGDALYIITEGSIRVFTYHLPDVKIPLAGLNKGDFFGEQALLGQSNKSRSANIEAITDTTVIKINEQFIHHLLQRDKRLKTRLLKLGCQQALSVLSLPTDFYNELESIISKIENPHVIDLPNDKIIFNVNDQPDNVYLILQGEVELNLPKTKTSKSNNLILHKGHIFGELGVLLNQPRAGTAIAHNNARLLAIEGAYFKSQVALNPRLQQVLSSLQKSYQLPTKGTVEQYIGNVLDMGIAITNIFKEENGQSIISSQFVNQDIFMMSIVGMPVQESYQYKDNQKQIELGIYHNRLTRIKSYGHWEDLPQVCHFLLTDRVIDEAKLVNFETTGKLKVEKRTEVSRKTLCACMSVTRKQIQDCIDKGIKTLDGISEATGACSICGACQPAILEMIGEKPWLTARMQKTITHNSHIKSYLIKPINGELKTMLPGQHIIIQMKIDDDWIERPYSISGVENGNIRITIKNIENGFFTQWLFEKAPDPLEVNITQPQGLFTLNEDANIEALCFAAGVGITPFITFAKALAAKHNKKRLHILYLAAKKEDFIFVDEFAELMKETPSLTISYHESDAGGLLNADDILKVVNSFNQPDIYICGSKEFTNFIQNSLNKKQYDKNRIHTEQFLHAGSIK